MSRWIKMGCEMLGDPKVLRAARRGHRGLEVLPWLLLFAGKADDDGRLSVGGESMEPEDLAVLAPVDPDAVAEALGSLEAIGVLVRDPDQVLRFARWEDWQQKPSDHPARVADRVQRHRRRQRDARAEAAAPISSPATTGSSGPVTPCNALRVTPRNALAETDETTRNALRVTPCNALDKKRGEKKREETHTSGRSRDTDACDEVIVVTSVEPDTTDPVTVDTSDFDVFWAEFPARPNNPKGKARRAWRARRTEGVAAADLIAGATRYAAYVARERVEPRFRMMAATFLGPDGRWAEPYAPAAEPDITVYDEAGEFTPEFLAAIGRSA